MMSGDFRREEVEEYDGDDSGLELSLGLSIGGRNSFFVEKRAAATEAQGPAGEVAGDSRWVFPQPRAAAAATLSRTVSGPPDAAEVRRRREMHAIKRQEARRKLEEKQIRKGGGGSGTAARGGGGRSSGGGGLWRTCSAGDRSAMEVHGQRGTVRDRNAADDYAHHRRKVGPKIDDRRSPTTSGAAGGGCATPPASNSLSGSTATPTASQIPPENSSSSNRKPNDDHDGGEPHPSAPYRTNPSNPTTPYPFPPMMPMPFPLHPAQYVHFTAGGPGFPYVMPCWNPQVPPDGNRSVPLQQQQPAAVVTPQPGRGFSSSFRPFRQQASGNVERGRSAEVNSSKPRTAATTARGMKRVPSLTGSQGSSFSAISDYRSDLDPNQGGSGSRGCGGDNTEPRADSPDRPAASGPTTMPGRSSPSRSINTSPAPSDHSVSSNPTAKADHKQQTPPSTGQPRQQKEPHPEPPASAADGMPEQATAAGPRPAVAAANTATTASTTNRRPAPRTMPYVCAKGTGPDGRTVIGFLYKFDDKDKVSIVCVCHGSSFTPAEFVRHAGATDVDNPLRHIVMIEEPPEHRVMVPSAS